MGFGFGGVRFGNFLQQLRIAQHTLSPQSYGLSPWSRRADRSWSNRECFAGWHHLRLVRELDRCETAHSRPSIQPVAIAFFLAWIRMAICAALIENVATNLAWEPPDIQPSPEDRLNEIFCLAGPCEQ
jgi:hypothetical protein